MHFYAINVFYLNPCSAHELLFNKNNRGPLLSEALFLHERGHRTSGTQYLTTSIKPLPCFSSTT